MENISNEDILETLKLDISRGKIHALLHVITFSDNGHSVVYNQSLGLSAYGDNEQEARKMFVEVVIPDFCKHLLEQNEATIFAFLKEHGWERHAIYKKDLSKKTHVDKDGILRDFDLASDTVIKEDFIAA